MSSDDSDSSGGEASRKYVTLQEVVESSSLLEPTSAAASHTAGAASVTACITADDPLALSKSISAEIALSELSLRQSFDGSTVPAADNGGQLAAPLSRPRGAAHRVEEHLRRSAVLRQRAAEAVALNSAMADSPPVVVDISAQGIRSLKRAYAALPGGRRNGDDAVMTVAALEEEAYPDVAPTPWYYYQGAPAAPSPSRLDSRVLTRPPDKSPHESHAARHEHYRAELQRFYETVFEVELDDQVLPSGGSRPPVSHLPPETYRCRREQLIDHLNNSVPLLLSKFHGFEEDLFRLLKAKYDAPAYRFRHYEDLSQ